MSKGLDELAIARMRSDYINDSESVLGRIWEKLAAKYKVSVPTVRRYSKSGDWENLRQAQKETAGAVIQGIKAVVTGTKVSEPETVIVGQPFDINQMLVTGIQKLSTDGATIPSKSGESALATMGKLIELYRKFNPLTLDEAIDLLIALPDFEPREFAKRLRDRLERQAV